MIYAKISELEKGLCTIFFFGEKEEEIYKKYSESFPNDDGVKDSMILNWLAKNDFTPVSENFFYKEN